MAARGLHTIEDPAGTVPTLTFRANASSKDRAAHIRGIGTISTSAGVEPSVFTVLDGVVLVRDGQQAMELTKVERIEILCGPQGTLFGKNASARVINVITASPAEQPGARLETSVSSDDEQRLRASVSGLVVPERLHYRRSGLWARYNGNVDHLATGKMVHGYLRRGARGTLQFRAADGVKLTLVGDYLLKRDDVPSGVSVSAGRQPRGRICRWSTRLWPRPWLARALAPRAPIATSRRRRQTGSSTSMPASRCRPSGGRASMF